jgi:hypothetical protein
MKQIFTLILLLSFAAFAEERPSYIMCKSGPIVRTIRVQLNGRACKAYYTKEGVDQIVGYSASPDLCYVIAGKIRINLENNHWKCRDISQTRVSSQVN